MSVPRKRAESGGNRTSAKYGGAARSYITDPSVAEEVRQAIEDTRRDGRQRNVRCPCHDDNRASLSIGRGKKVAIVGKCQAGCSFDQEVLPAIGMTSRELRPHGGPLPPPRPKSVSRSQKPAKPSSNGKRTIVAEYDYVDADGELLYQALRYAPKDFRPRRPDGKGGWIWNLEGVRRVLYRLPELRAAKRSNFVFIVEGEKDVENLRKLKLVATCNLGGAGKWRPEYSKELRGRHVVILPDNDDAGRNHAEQVAEALDGIAKSVRILELPGLPEKGDVSDWIAAVRKGASR